MLQECVNLASLYKTTCIGKEDISTQILAQAERMSGCFKVERSERSCAKASSLKFTFSVQVAQCLHPWISSLKSRLSKRKNDQKERAFREARRPRFRVLALLWDNPIFSLILSVSTIHIKGYCRHWCQGLISEFWQVRPLSYLSLRHSESRVCLAPRKEVTNKMFDWPIGKNQLVNCIFLEVWLMMSLISYNKINFIDHFFFFFGCWRNPA